MKTIKVPTQPAYEVRIGRGTLSEVGAGAARFARLAVLTDDNVGPLYGKRLSGLERAPSLTVPPGETSKGFGTLERVLDFMVETGLDRRSCLVLLGGGVIGDLGGLAASLFMRGIAFVQVPTTLLAQVDSSVGGKTAINLRGGKNLAGTFHQPSLVITDTNTLATLDEDEYRSGLGEVVKSALIEGESALALLEQETRGILRRDPGVMERVVEQCVRTKAAIVARDPIEGGERKALNLGHTFAHGIEHAAGYGRIPHGLAVAVGLMLSLRASRELGLAKDPDLITRVGQLLGKLCLPAHLDDLRSDYRVTLEPADLTRGMAHDKKGSASAPRFVLLEKAGQWKLDVEAPAGVVEELLARAPRV